ncbi:hypothetical protein QE430_002572 [Microbacterium testaceum]|nr:hypothetical protein [Microbacterium testaceum]
MRPYTLANHYTGTDTRVVTDPYVADDDGVRTELHSVLDHRTPTTLESMTHCDTVAKNDIPP